MRTGLHISPPADWVTVEHPGFVVHLDPQRQSPLAFALSVAAGLDSRPRRLDASYLYDAAGSELFERITAQPEYYLTRAEDRLLAANAASVRRLAGPSVLVELGSGASTKTRRLLDAWTQAGTATYAPIDVDAHALAQACAALHRQYPRLAIQGVAATYERGLGVLRGSAPITVAFLGSSLGNLGWREYPEFCATVAEALTPGDHFLVGLDLVKSPAVLEAAYNDAAGITAAFTRNLFARMNRELETDIPADAVEHVAYYDTARERIEIFAEARRELVIPVRVLEREFRIARGERILTEVSHKFRPEAAVATVERSGFRLAWRDEGDGEVGLFMFSRVVGASASGGPSRPQGSRAGGRGMAMLTEMRARTLQLVAPLGDEDLQGQHSPLMSPIAWDLGHIAHFEELWLLPDRSAAATPHEQSLTRLYDPLATPRSRRSELPIPAPGAVRRRMREVRQSVEERSTRWPQGDDAGDGRTAAAGGAAPRLETEFAVQLVVQHEAQHQETILQAIALRDDLEYRPLFATDTALPQGARPVGETVLVPEGPFVMGTNDRAWTYDNERPAHQVHLPPYRIDRAPVTNGQYLAFMADGGYSRRDLWCEAGWGWLQERRVQAPAHWRMSAPRPSGREQSQSQAQSQLDWETVTFGRLQPLHPDDVVVHVSWYEASAYARWVGGRLPTEAEWEKAAAWDPTQGRSRRYPWGDAPWEPARANLDQLRLQPAHVGAYPQGRSAYGCLQMLGDVWEWTDSWFQGYAGFESFPYKEYSQIFFGERYRVLRGGAFATRALAARNTFRNWDLPERRQIFAGFRCVRAP